MRLRMGKERVSIRSLKRERWQPNSDVATRSRFGGQETTPREASNTPLRRTGEPRLARTSLGTGLRAKGRSIRKNRKTEIPEKGSCRRISQEVPTMTEKLVKPGCSFPNPRRGYKMRDLPLEREGEKLIKKSYSRRRHL